MSYPGWRIAWTLDFVEFTLYGILYYTFSVFILPLEQELGWTRAKTSLGFSLALLTSALLAPTVGRFVDKNGARALMTYGALGAAALTFLWSRVTSLPAFYAVWTLMGLAWAAVFYPVAFTVIAVWFRRDRPKAMLLVTLVAGLASAAFIPLDTLLLEHFGWRSGVEILALGVAFCAIPLWIFLRHRPADLGLHPDGVAIEPSNLSPEPNFSPELIRKQPAFWWLTLSFALNAASTVALAAHLRHFSLPLHRFRYAVLSRTAPIGPARVLSRTAQNGTYRACSRLEQNGTYRACSPSGPDRCHSFQSGSLSPRRSTSAKCFKLSVSSLALHAVIVNEYGMKRTFVGDIARPFPFQTAR